MSAPLAAKLKGLLTLLFAMFLLSVIVSFFLQTQWSKDVAIAHLKNKFPSETPHVLDHDILWLSGWEIRFSLSGGRRGWVIIDTKQRIAGLPLFGNYDALFVTDWQFVDLNKFDE